MESVKLHWTDILVFCLTFAISMGIGLYFALSGERQSTTKEFLMGNRNLAILPVALSMFMTYVSVVLVLGTSAEMYQYGTQQLTQAIGSTVAYMMSAFIIVPVLFPLKLVSVYQYHEMRFQSKALRKILSFVNAFQATFVTGLGIYSPAIALQAVTGMNIWVTVICIGVVATIYTSIGGMKAVVWTDSFQFIIFLIGVLTLLIMGAAKVSSIQSVWKISEEGGRIIFFKTVLLNIPMMIFIYAIMGLIGLTVYAYYAMIGCDPLRAGYIKKSNQLLSYFVVEALGYTGFSGLFIAILSSSALSSISSSMSAVAALLWKDFLEARVGNVKEHQKALMTKIIVLIVGGVAISLAVLIQYLPGHVLQISNSVMGSISGALAGVLILGLCVPFSNSKGAIAGILSALALLTWINVGQFLTHPFKETLPTDVSNCTFSGNKTAKPQLSDPEDVFPLYAISFYWFGIIGIGTSVIVGIIVSLITGPQNLQTIDKRLVVPCCYDICSNWQLGICRRKSENLSEDRQVPAIGSSEQNHDASYNACPAEQFIFSESISNVQDYDMVKL